MKKTGPSPTQQDSTAVDKATQDHFTSAPAPVLFTTSKSPRKIVTRNRVHVFRTPEPKKHYSHGSITQLNGTLMSPAKNIKVLTEFGIGIHGEVSLEEVALNDLLNLSSPIKGPQSRSLVEGETTLLRSRTINSHNGCVSIYLSENKVNFNDEITPPPARPDLEETVEDLGLPVIKDNKIEDIKISKKTLENVQREKAKHHNRRVPDNKKVTCHVGANRLAQAIGLETKAQDWQYLHMIGHSLWGNQAQKLSNFVLGKKHENGVMNDLAESLIEKILNLPNAPKALYLSAEAEWVPGYESARVAQKLLWTLRDGPKTNYSKFVQFEFNPLSTRKLAKNEMAQMKELLLHLFENDMGVKLVSPNKSIDTTMKSPKKSHRLPSQNLAPIPLGHHLTSEDADMFKSDTPPRGKRNLFGHTEQQPQDFKRPRRH